MNFLTKFLSFFLYTRFNIFEKLLDEKIKVFLNQPVELTIKKQLSWMFKIDIELKKIIEKIAKKRTRGTKITWEDAAQTAYMKIWEAYKANKFKGTKNQFLRWSAAVAKFAIIDLVRKEKKNSLVSLDSNVPGTNITLIENISDRFDLMDALERADLIVHIKNTVVKLDERFPKKGYLALYEKLVQGEKNTQIARERGITQGTISKRKWDLIKLIAEELSLLEIKNLKQQDKSRSQSQKARQRSKQKW